MTRHFTLFSLFSFLLLLALALPSCKDFEGPQTVPAYLRIDTMRVSCDYYTYGANTHNFTDVWVYVDDDVQGAFELPAVVPLLYEGQHKVALYPGIKVNGIAQTRADYPFIAPAEYASVNLVKDSIVTLTPTFTYYPEGDNLHMRWIEDFDGGFVSLESTSLSDVTFTRVNGPQAWHDPQGIYSSYSGKVVLTSDTLRFQLATSEEFRDLPTTGSACMLEMDYKCSDTCLVGLYYKENNSIYEYPVLRVSPTSESGVEPTTWKKIYVNIGPYLVDYKDADYFKLYFSSWNPRNDGTQYFYFDNLKLIYRDR
ncbi:MAG: hypothetical protein IKT08_00715 [Bacteroidales bacterium]|nr:hypothetical protein [Bacteroidales bacterium]